MTLFIFVDWYRSVNGSPGFCSEALEALMNYAEAIADDNDLA